MRKYNYNSTYSYRSKPRSWLQWTLLLILVGIPLLLLLLELAVRGIVGVTGFERQLSAAQDSSIAQAYGLKLAEAKADKLAGQLLVKPSPLLGYELVPRQKYKYWQLNEQGFRSDRPLPQTKPAGEIRIFLLGNSTAFGQMASQNQATIAAKLEKLLAARLQAQTQQPEKFKPIQLPYFADQVAEAQKLPPRLREGTYRVITAAVPGYTSANELSLVAHRIMAYQPDGILVLNGYEDLRSPSQEIAKEVKTPLTAASDPGTNYRNFMGEQLQGWFNGMATVRVMRYWLAPSTTAQIEQSFKANQFSQDSQELNKRVVRYSYNLHQISSLAVGIPLVVALQPEITGKANSLSEPEQQILKQLGADYRQRLQTGYAALDLKELAKRSPKIKFIDLYRSFDGSTQSAFADPIHLTEFGNTAIANRFFEVLEEILAQKPTPPV